MTPTKKDEPGALTKKHLAYLARRDVRFAEQAKKAKARYIEQLGEIVELLGDLRDFHTDLQNDTDAAQVDWGYVGTLDHRLAQLGEVRDEVFNLGEFAPEGS